MSNNIRVRFAPSPTGPLHIGGVRTALYNYLFAKKHGGTFILRIEDTDQKRYVTNAEKYIIEALNWSGIPFDEGVGKEGKFAPYRQSERKDIYKKHIQTLIDKDWAYYAFDTPEELATQRKQHEAAGKTFSYNQVLRKTLNNSISLSKDEVSKRLDKGDSYVIRFKTPQDETVYLTDIIRGDMKIDTNTLDDKVLFKSDGIPTYHFANIVDDHEMEISHVIRGEEWLPSLALHVMLYKAFEWKAPEFAHLPLLLKPVGKGKLSKRDGDKLGFPVFPLEYTNEKTNEVSRGYREDGYFPEAFINMLAFLGWNPGTEQELFSLEELVAAFSLERVSKSGAKFDLDKTKWFQQQYMKTKSDAELVELFNPYLEPHLGGFMFTDFNTEYRTKVVSLIKERATFVSDLWDLASFFFLPPFEYDPKATKKAWKEDTAEIMQNLKEVVENTHSFTSDSIENNVKEWIKESELGFGKVLMPFRLSLVGSMQGPHVFDIAALIGKEETLSRMNRIIKELD
ncbi:MAG TPA: glutamate--tRNA ligase [Lutibacter sp.]|nr:glutamate--tRNA ligase [Lutibacter sp.]